MRSIDPRIDDSDDYAATVSDLPYARDIKVGQEPLLVLSSADSR
jgi:hypothetical protein